MIKIRCILHADFETPGVITDWAKKHNFPLQIEKPYKNEYFSDEDYDFLIIMGGLQSSLEINKHPYLNDEIKIIKKALLNNKLILGFCLGAQLIGEALGAKAERSPNTEIGVFPITLTDHGKRDKLFFDFPERFNVTHWHNDMPGLTPESKLLAYSEGCPRQVVKYSENVYSFQCHPEMNKDNIRSLIKACPEALTNHKYVQNAQVLLKNNYAPINEKMFTILDRLINNQISTTVPGDSILHTS